MILVTGATGFLGTHTIPLLIKEDVGPIRCFVRKTSDVSLLREYPNIEIVYGEFEDRESLKQALTGASSLINIASLGFGYGPGIIKACEEMGVTRTLFVSTTAMFTNLNAQTKTIRQEAEKKIIESHVNHTILRPTMIYGTEKDRNMCRLIKVLNKTPVFPVFGSGEYLQQPIHVDDLARAIIDTFNSTNTINKEYNLSGQYPLTYNEVIKQTAEALGKKVTKFHLSLNLSRLVFRVYEKMSSKPRIKEEQILRLNEDKAFSHEAAINDFGFVSRSFREGITQEIERMKQLKII